MSQNFATFDAATLPSDVTLELADTTARTSSTVAKTIRSTQPRRYGVWQVEFLAYGTLGTGSDVRVGVCIGAAANDIKLGEDGNSVAYTAAGTVRAGGTTAATYAAWTLGDVIGMVIDNENRAVTWFKNGVPAGAAQTLPGTVADDVMPAVTLIAGAGDDTTTPDVRILYNAGQQTLEHPTGALAGWFDVPAGIGLVRAADRAYRDPLDPTSHWPSSLADASLAVTRAVSFWPWGNKATRAQATLRLLNADGRYDNLIAQDARDAQVTVRRLADGEALADADAVLTYIADSVQAPDDMSISLTLRDSSAALETPLQRRLTLPTVDEQMRAKPWPLVLGAVRSLPLACIDAEQQVYAINDGPIAGVGSIRDRGAQFIPSLGDYILQQDGPGTVTLASIAQGVVTADVSSLGGTSPTPPVDILGGKGDMTNPSDWTTTSGGITWTVPQTPNPHLHGVSSGGSMGMFGTVTIPGLTMIAGTTYMVRLTMQALSDPMVWNTSNGNPTANIRLCYPGTLASFFTFGAVKIFTPGYRGQSGGYDPSFDAATQPVVIIGTAAVSGPLAIGFQCSHLGGMVDISDIKVWQLLDHEIDDDSLVPITFAASMQAILGDRLGWQPSQWSLDDALAIDAATGYAGVGIASTVDAPLTVAQAVQMVCDAYCVATWQDESGMLRFTRLVDPASEPSTATITANDMLTEPAVSIDLAPNLTTQLAARRNWRPLTDSEMVSDDVGLPMATNGGTE